MTAITIGIASMGRPQLLKTMASLNAIMQPSGHSIAIVIADDSSTNAVAILLEKFESRYPFQIETVASSNLSTARNVCLEKATGDWLAFVDDDETVEPKWLVELIETAEQYKAQCVFAPVYPQYPTDTPQWFIDENPLFQDWDWHERGRETDSGRSGNTLIDMNFIRKHKLTFSTHFGKTGGEDTDFFQRCAKLGAKMVVTDLAPAYEFVPANRATVDYVFDRRLRTGQLYAHILKQSPEMTPVKWFLFTLVTIIKFKVSGIQFILFGFAGPKLRLRFRSQIASNLGKLREVFGNKIPVISSETNTDVPPKPTHLKTK